jgi:hypothetical protein
VRRLAATLAVVLLGAALAAPAPASADSDPASDTLLLADVFFPVEPPLPQSYSNAIRSLAATMKKSGYPVKVAIIATANDLGLVPQLFNKPQAYAPYLGREIAFNTKKPLLVVMPVGYGTYSVAPNVAAAVTKLKAPGSDLQSMGKGTIDAMAAMAQAAGHPVKKPSVSGGGGSGGTSPAIIFGVPVLILALAGLLAALKRRSDEKREAAAPERP